MLVYQQKEGRNLQNYSIYPEQLTSSQAMRQSHLSNDIKNKYTAAALKYYNMPETEG